MLHLKRRRRQGLAFEGTGKICVLSFWAAKALVSPDRVNGVLVRHNGGFQVIERGRPVEVSGEVEVLDFTLDGEIVDRELCYEVTLGLDAPRSVRIHRLECLPKKAAPLVALLLGFIFAPATAAELHEPVWRVDSQDLAPIDPPFLRPGEWNPVQPLAPVPVPIIDEVRSCEEMELRIHQPDAPPSQHPGDITMREAFARHLLPSIEGPRAKSTTRDYWTAIGHWEAFVASRASTASTRAAENVCPIPVVDSVYQISDHQLNEFGRWLMVEIPTGAGLKLSTAGKQWKKLRAILKRVGPRGHGNPKGVGLIEFVPAMDPLTDLIEIADEDDEEGAEDLSDDEIGRIYEAAESAAWPGDHAALQWQTYMVVMRMLGHRPNDGATVTEASFILDPRSPVRSSTRTHEHGWSRYRQEKTKKTVIVPLPKIVRVHVEALLRLRGGRLFEWTNSKGEKFRETWKDIVA